MRMKKQDLNAVRNFDFLARSFARMYAMGQPVDIDAVTGNMTEEQKQWFLEHYNHYCQQAQRARVKELQ
ncbi:cell surface composition regulator GlgS [Enterobacter sp. NFIX03]